MMNPCTTLSPAAPGQPIAPPPGPLLSCPSGLSCLNDGITVPPPRPL